MMTKEPPSTPPTSKAPLPAPRPAAKRPPPAAAGAGAAERPLVPLPPRPRAGTPTSQIEAAAAPEPPRRVTPRTLYARSATMSAAVPPPPRPAISRLSPLKLVDRMVAAIDPAPLATASGTIHSKRNLPDATRVVGPARREASVLLADPAKRRAGTGAWMVAGAVTGVAIVIALVVSSIG